MSTCRKKPQNTKIQVSWTTADLGGKQVIWPPCALFSPVIKGNHLSISATARLLIPHCSQSALRSWAGRQRLGTRSNKGNAVFWNITTTQLARSLSIILQSWWALKRDSLLPYYELLGFSINIGAKVIFPCSFLKKKKKAVRPKVAAGEWNQCSTVRERLLLPASHPQALSHHGPQIASSISAESQGLDIKNSSTLRHGDDNGKGREEIKVLHQLGHDTGPKTSCCFLTPRLKKHPKQQKSGGWG